MNGYELSRDYFDFSFENPEKIKPLHTAIYFFAIEHCNRLGWKESFGFPSQMVMEAIGVKNWKTYSKGLTDLVNWGFIDMIEISRNQYSSNIIALVKNTKANTKALDKALSNHSRKQVLGIVSIDKQITTNNKPNNNKKRFNFRKSLLELSSNEKLVDDWMKVRKQKKAANTETAFNGFLREFNKSGLHIDEVLRICAENSWKGFKFEWINNLNDGKSTETTTDKLRDWQS